MAGEWGASAALWALRALWAAALACVARGLSGDAEFPAPLFSLDLQHHRPQDDRRRLVEDSEIAPLFQGRGIHYSFIWVGSPPQRVSVIMDTGSHHTAFPCVGCKCGKHMNPFFNPERSSSASVKSCGLLQSNSKCFFRQSYSEGSSWHAYKVSDKVYIGGEKIGDVPSGGNFSVDFEFGCQDLETGLFRTQHVDGIMGLSASEETLPFQLFQRKVVATKAFALCLRLGGGVLTIGGVDPALHRFTPATPRDNAASVTAAGLVQSQVLYARLLKAKGWYTVNLLDILLVDPADGSAKSIGGPIFKSQGSKGTIVDSGTTDTYLPSALAAGFKALFKAIARFPYENKAVKLDAQRFRALPVVVYRLEGADGPGSSIDVEVHPQAYMEKHTADSYTPRIYVTEPSGAVLGANFMSNYNTIFDVERLRVGFARSDCIPTTPSAPSAGP